MAIAKPFGPIRVAVRDDGLLLAIEPPNLTDEANILEYDRRLRQVISAGYSSILLDLHEINAVSSVALGMLISANRRLLDAKGDLRLVNVGHELHKLFAVTLLDRLFKIPKDPVDRSFLVPLPKGITSREEILLQHLGAFSIGIGYGNGKLHVLPVANTGAASLFTGNAGQELIIGSAHAVARSMRLLLHKQVVELEKLINDKGVAERDLQEFFEQNPEFVLGQQYVSVRSQVLLTRSGTGPLIPDFLLEPADSRFCDILDLKLPNVPLVTGRRDRKRFSAEVADAVAQLREYGAYFEDSERRNELLRQTGFSAYDPKLTVLIGRRTTVDPFILRRIKAGQAAEIITYDDLLEKAKRLVLL